MDDDPITGQACRFRWRGCRQGIWCADDGRAGLLRHYSCYVRVGLIYTDTANLYKNGQNEESLAVTVKKDR